MRVVAGDPSHFDSVFRINVEGVLAVNGTPTTANRWFEGTVTVTVSDGRLTVSNASGASNNKINFIEVTAAGRGRRSSRTPGPTAWSSIEAENFDGNVGQGGKSWTPYTATAGFSGTGALQATPNTGVNNDTGYVANSPRLDYRINFVKTGVHYVWVRGVGPTGSDDSVHVGLDGAAVATADRISSLPGTGYGWTQEHDGRRGGDDQRHDARRPHAQPVDARGRHGRGQAGPDHEQRVHADRHRAGREPSLRRQSLAAGLSPTPPTRGRPGPPPSAVRWLGARPSSTNQMPVSVCRSGPTRSTTPGGGGL